jgi:hypothetical protein
VEMIEKNPLWSLRFFGLLEEISKYPSFCCNPNCKTPLKSYQKISGSALNTL